MSWRARRPSGKPAPPATRPAHPRRRKRQSCGVDLLTADFEKRRAIMVLGARPAAPARTGLPQAAAGGAGRPAGKSSFPPRLSRGSAISPSHRPGSDRHRSPGTPLRPPGRPRGVLSSRSEEPTFPAPLQTLCTRFMEHEPTDSILEGVSERRACSERGSPGRPSPCPNNFTPGC
jgi:hypothetical protein